MRGLPADLLDDEPGDDVVGVAAYCHSCAGIEIERLLRPDVQDALRRGVAGAMNGRLT